MRIIVLGGAGDMAGRAVADLVAEPDVSAVTVADYNLDAARLLATKLGEKARAVWVDADQHDSLVEAIRGHQAAASGIGPFYRYEVPVARAAVEAGVPYVSLCDDFDAAQGVLGLDEQARQSGVTVITGLGWTPGLSNMLAVRAAGLFDRVDEVNVAWGSSASDSEGYAVILHTMHIFTGRVPSYQRGRLIDVQAGSGKEPVLFPPPVGLVNCYHVGHPEPLTLPRCLPSARSVTLKGGLVEQPLNDLAIWLARLRLTDTPAKLDRMGQIIKAALPALSKLGQPENPCSAVRVDVSGWVGEAYEVVSLGATGHMRELTGLPLAIGALMLARGDVRRPGVVAPEACLAPERFFEEMESRGVRVQSLSGQWPREERRRAAASRAQIAVGALAAWMVLRALRRRR